MWHSPGLVAAAVRSRFVLSTPSVSGGSALSTPSTGLAEVHAGDALQDAHAPGDRAGLHRVRADRQHRRKGQHAGSQGGVELHGHEGERLPSSDGGGDVLDLPGHGGPPFVRGRRLTVDRPGVARHVAVVAGHQLCEGARAVEDRLLDEQLGLELHRVADGPDDRRPQRVVVAGVVHLGGEAEPGAESAARRSDQEDLFGAEPLMVEVDDGRPCLRVVEHALSLAFEAFRGVEFAGAGRPEQLVVRHRVPEEVRQPRGELPRIEGRRIVRARLELEVERRGLQDAGDGEGHRLVDRFGFVLYPPERLDPVALPVAQGPAPGALGKPEDARCGAGLTLRGREVGPSGAVEEGRRQQGEGPEVHPGEVQFLDLVGGRILALRDALEAVGAWLGRKMPRPRVGWWRRREHALAGGAPRADPVGNGRSLRPQFAVSGEAEQVGDRVVVLGRRERQGRCFARCARLPGLARCRQREGGGAQKRQDGPEVEFHGGCGSGWRLRALRTCNTVSVPPIPGRRRDGPRRRAGQGGSGCEASATRDLARRCPTCAG